MTPRENPGDRIAIHSVEWLTNTFLAYLETMVKAGKCSPGTYKQRRLYYDKLCAFPATYGKAAGQPFSNAR